MSTTISLSVIIPVYNGERFIEKAVQSVLTQIQVSEIIVVNDGSTDGTLTILEELQKQYALIKIYHHKNQENKGRSATRNLGIQNATGDYIAFLDADDYYLPNRFVNDFKVFNDNVSCDGVYNAIGVCFYRPAVLEEHDSLQLYTVTQKVNPEDLFQTLLSGAKGHFSIDGLTVKKSVFEKIGLFNEDLVVAEDTDVFWKMAITCRLETGIIGMPLAVRGVHEDNVFSQTSLYQQNRIQVYASLLIWGVKNQIKNEIIDDLLKRIWIIRYKEKHLLLSDFKFWIQQFLPHPQLLFSRLSIKYFPLVRLRKVLFPFLFR